MALTFLCATHREWLVRQPDQAIESYTNASKKSIYLMDQRQWKQAIPYLGCALESAEILLATRAMSPSISLDWYLQSLARLIGVLNKLDFGAGCVEVYSAAIDFLRGELGGEAEINLSLESQINRLIRELAEMESPTRVGYAENTGKSGITPAAVLH